jgi:hypothetical protein
MCVFALLGCHRALVGGLLLRCQVNISVSYSRLKQSRRILGMLNCFTLKDGTSMLFPDIGTQLLTINAQHPTRAKPQLQHSEVQNLTHQYPFTEHRSLQNIIGCKHECWNLGGFWLNEECHSFHHQTETPKRFSLPMLAVFQSWKKPLELSISSHSRSNVK